MKHGLPKKRIVVKSKKSTSYFLVKQVREMKKRSFIIKDQTIKKHLRSISEKHTSEIKEEAIIGENESISNNSREIAPVGNADESSLSNPDTDLASTTPMSPAAFDHVKEM